MPSFTVFKGSEDGKVVKSTTTKPDQLTGDSVLVKITASGVCGTGMLPGRGDVIYFANNHVS